MLGPRLDTELVGDALLVGPKRELGRDHVGALLADHRKQVETSKGIRITQGLGPAAAQFHCNRVDVEAGVT